MLVAIHIHLHCRLIPDKGEEMVLSILKAMGPGAVPGVVGANNVSAAHILVVAPVAGTVEVSVLSTGGNAAFVAHLDDVYLCATWPSYLIIIVSHHPECRPEAVGG